MCGLYTLFEVIYWQTSHWSHTQHTQGKITERRVIHSSGKYTIDYCWNALQGCPPPHPHPYMGHPHGKTDCVISHKPPALGFKSEPSSAWWLFLYSCHHKTTMSLSPSLSVSFKLSISLSLSLSLSHGKV